MFENDGGEEENETAPSLPEVVTSSAPDGGWGWIVALGCFLTHVLTDGMFYSFGLIYVDLLDAFGGTKGETAWIASIAPGVLLLVGPVVGSLTNRFGCRLVTIWGALISSASLILSSFAPNLFFLYFSLGTLTGVGYGMIYLPSIVCVSKYFEKKLALATGLGVCGAGIGTFIFSPFTEWLLYHYTWRGTFLIQSAIVLNCAACGMIFRPLALNYSASENKNGISEVDTDLFDTTTCVLTSHFSNHRHGGNEANNAQTDGPFPLQRYLSAPSCYNKLSDTKTSEDHEPGKNILESDCKYGAKAWHKSEPDLHRIVSMQSSVTPMALFLSTGGVAKASTMASKEELSGEDSDGCKKKRNIWQSCKTHVNFALLADKKLLLFITSSFLYSIGYYVPYIYLPDRARDAGIDQFRGAWLISSIGITNTAGRVLFGFISDRKRVNRLYLYSIALTLCGICTATGPLFNNFGLLLMYAMLFGIFSGVTISLTSVLLVDLMGIDKLTDAFGLSNLFCGIATFLGSPIAGWLYDASGSYHLSFVVAGVTIALSGLMLFAIPCIDR